MAPNSPIVVATPEPVANTGRKRRLNDEEGLESGPVNKKRKPTNGKAAATKKTARTTKKSESSRPPTIKKSTKKSIKSGATKQKTVDGEVGEASVTKIGNKKKAVQVKSTKPKKKAAPKAPPIPKEFFKYFRKSKFGPQINWPPFQALEVYVFGEGSSGELGLGHKVIDGKPVMDVPRPIYHPFLSGKVVQIACGSMHGIALTRMQTVVTWGVNDPGVLGRDTTSRPDEESNGDDENNSLLNPRASIPAEIDNKGIEPDTRFAHVAACDSASFALTEDGRVYSWGTFRNGDGILGFSKDVLVQPHAVLLPEPRNVVALATGSNHVVALDEAGRVHTWGAPEQCQLGRRVVQRDARASALRPAGVAFPRGVRVRSVAAGAHHSFAIDEDGRAWAWGLNNYGQLGVAAVPGDDAGAAVVLQPTLVEAPRPDLQNLPPLPDGRRVVSAVGGEHHSLFLYDGGEVFSVGRASGHQLGLPEGHFTPENTIFGEHGEPRILHKAARLGVPQAKVIAVGADSNLVVTHEGAVYAWGYNDNFQCGVGETVGDVIIPTQLTCGLLQNRWVQTAGCGGHYGILASHHDPMSGGLMTWW